MLTYKLLALSRVELIDMSGDIEAFLVASLLFANDTRASPILALQERAHLLRVGKSGHVKGAFAAALLH